MNSLVERLPDLVREWGSVTAARDDTDGRWRFLSWSELDAEVNRLTGAVAVQRGEAWAWDAPAGTRRLALTLALLHLGAEGALQGPDAEWIDPETWERWTATREDPGRLVRLRAELRPRDPALALAGRRLDHAGVVALAERVARALALGPPEVVLVSAGATAEQAVGLGALVGGYLVAVTRPDRLGVVRPSAWVCTPEQLRAQAPPPSRAGRLGALLRHQGRADQALGDRLRRVYVDGPVPAEAERYRERGIEVAPWAD